MGKKKAPKNAFYFFFSELKGKQKHPCSNDDAVKLASPLWNKMSPEERKPYEEKARIAKNNQVKETCAGESLHTVLASEKITIERNAQIKTNIETMIKLANSDGTLPGTDFYLVHINHFFYHDLSQKYYPAEIAMGKFNLRNGIIKDDVFHSFIYPGAFPMGYKLTARQRAEETHKLPIDFGEKNNIKMIVENLIDFNKDKIPVFTLERDIKCIERILENIFEECDMYNPFDVYPLDYLLFILKNIVHGPENNVWPVASLGTTWLERDVYQTREEIACLYHYEVERPVHCSLAKVIRWAYTICDQCSHFLNIKLIPGRHVPVKSDVNNIPIDNVTSTLSETNISSRNSAKSAQITTNSRASNSDMTSIAGARGIQKTNSYDAYNSDIASYHGFESTDDKDIDEDDEWKQPKYSVRLKRNQKMSGNEDGFSGADGSQSQPSETQSQGTQSQSQTPSLHLSDLSYKSSYLPGRQPESTSLVGYRGRGRGRFVNRQK